MGLTAEFISLVFGLTMVAWLAILAGFVSYKFLTGHLSMTGLLQKEGGSALVPERVTALATTLFVAGAYILIVLNTGLIEDPVTDVKSMPDMPEALLALLVGGKAVYVTGKISRQQKTGS